MVAALKQAHWWAAVDRAGKKVDEADILGKQKKKLSVSRSITKSRALHRFANVKLYTIPNATRATGHLATHHADVPSTCTSCVGDTAPNPVALIPFSVQPAAPERVTHIVVPRTRMLRDIAAGVSKKRHVAPSKRVSTNVNVQLPLLQRQPRVPATFKPNGVQCDLQPRDEVPVHLVMIKADLALDNECDAAATMPTSLHGA